MLLILTVFQELDSHSIPRTDSVSHFHSSKEAVFSSGEKKKTGVSVTARPLKPSPYKGMFGIIPCLFFSFNYFLSCSSFQGKSHRETGPAHSQLKPIVSHSVDTFWVPLPKLSWCGHWQIVIARCRLDQC